MFLLQGEDVLYLDLQTIWSIVRFIRAVKNVRGHKVNYRRAFRVVLVPPAEYDKELYNQVKPDMKLTVRLQLLEGEEQLQVEELPTKRDHLFRNRLCLNTATNSTIKLTRYLKDFFRL